MTTPLIVLSRIRTAGGSITVVDHDLEVSVPAGLLSDQDRGVLAQHKSKVVELLASDQGVGEELIAIDCPDPCPKCKSLWLWWDSWGHTHCERCDPPREIREEGGKICQFSTMGDREGSHAHFLAANT